MRTPARLLLLLLASLPLTLQAQSTQADLEARLLHKPLYLRGQWRSDELHFDTVGQLLGDKASPMSFTLGGVDIEKVKLAKEGLVLEGGRIGVEFSRDVPKRVRLSDGRGHVESIRIQVDPSSDFGPALQAIFADSLADLTPSLPFYWQPYARVHFLGQPAPEEPKHPSGGNMTAPKILKTSEPTYGDRARNLRYGGRSVLSITLGEQGKITQASIVQPLGLGLDEESLHTILLYKFAPATRDGQPYSVLITINVDFER